MKTGLFQTVRTIGWAFAVLTFFSCGDDSGEGENPLTGAGGAAALGGGAGSTGPLAGTGAAGRAPGGAGSSPVAGGGTAGRSPAAGSGATAGTAAGSVAGVGGVAGAAGGTAGASGSSAGSAAGASGSSAGAGGRAGSTAGASGGSAGAAAGSGGAAGGGAGTSGSGSAATFTEVYGIIMAGCSCHNTGAGMLNMSTKAMAHTNLVGTNAQACGGQQKRVVAGNPEMSVFYRSLDQSALGSCMPPRMPQGRPKLGAADLEKVRSWIQAGALNN